MTTAIRPPATRDVINSVVIGLVLTALSYAVGLSAGWEKHLNWLEVFAVFTSYSCTWLCNVERRINYPIGAISTAAYSVLFFQSHLYASAILNAYLTPALLYGWYRWKRDSDTRPVKWVQPKYYLAYVLATGVAFAGAVLLATGLGDHLARTDSAILVGTILAQFLLDNKKLENWIVWFAVDVFATYTYAKGGLPLAAFQYVFFLANCFWGFYVWYRSYQTRKPVPEPFDFFATREELAATRLKDA